MDHTRIPDIQPSSVILGQVKIVQKYDKWSHTKKNPLKYIKKKVEMLRTHIFTISIH